MDTQSLKAFLAVAGQHSFSEAAEQLHLTQSAVSKRIQQLESQLGTPLFDRHNRTVSLTEAGHALLPRAQAILDLRQQRETPLKTGYPYFTCENKIFSIGIQIINNMNFCCLTSGVL